MTRMQFISDPDQLASSFRHLCDWAEEIIICTARFDCGDDHVPFRLPLHVHAAKVRHFIVAGYGETSNVLDRFHDRGVLRLIVERRSRIRANIYRFQKANEVRTLIGTARLTPESFGSDLEAMMLVEGSWHDEFACELSAFIERCLKNARVSHADDFQVEDANAFLAIEDRDLRAQTVWEVLLGVGPLDWDSAVREAARLLRIRGMIDFKRLDSAGPAYGMIQDAIQRGARMGLFDRPSRGVVRAILSEATEYPEWLWENCLLQSLDTQDASRAQAIRLAAEWAACNVGLAYRQIRAGGRIESAIKRAISRCIRNGRLERSGPQTIRRVVGTADARDR